MGFGQLYLPVGTSVWFDSTIQLTEHSSCPLLAGVIKMFVIPIVNDHSFVENYRYSSMKPSRV